MPVMVSSATAAKMFHLAQAADFTQCETKAKNVSQMGKKVLGYAGVTCMYNYSDDKNVDALTTMFMGMAETIKHGKNLERLRRFDRLGLDAEINLLDAQLKSGAACEAGLIAETLRGLVRDSQVMTRVRLKAERLLAGLQ